MQHVLKGKEYFANEEVRGEDTCLPRSVSRPPPRQPLSGSLRPCSSRGGPL